MVDRGPLLTSAIIFYLSIGAAIFEVLEEPYWRAASDEYKSKKTQLLKEFPCLGQEGLDRILKEYVCADKSKHECKDSSPQSVLWAEAPLHQNPETKDDAK
ncbi:UNVERIFIED_CONTAM: Potassium channel subfamily K member 5 [Gekko kuhli]